MGSTFDPFSDANLEDVIHNPRKFGAPSFEEFCRTPDRWRKKSQEWFEAIDAGSKILGKRHLKKQYYKLNGYRFETLEAVELAARNMGLNPWTLVPKPEVRDLGGGWCDLEVTMTPPTEESPSGIIL